MTSISRWLQLSARAVEKIGDIFQQATKYHPDQPPLSWPPPGRPPPSTDERYLTENETMDLPEVDWTSPVPLWETIFRRRSVRAYSPDPLSRSELSQLLGAGQGVTDRRGSYAFLASPSAGALYPLETYLVVHRVRELDSGIYRYRVGDHKLEVIARGDFRREAARAALGQPLAAQAAALFIWTAVIERSRLKYGQRCYRYLYLEAGHLAQNLCLAAVALGLGSCMIGALYDDLVNRMIKVDGSEETVLYMASVGKTP